MIKTILLHVVGGPRDDANLAYAVALARHHAAHLKAVYVEPPADMPPAITGRGASAVYLATLREELHRRAGECEQRFRAAMAREDLSWEWQADVGDPGTVLVAHAHFADLAVVAKTEPATLEDEVAESVVEELLLSASCPTVVLPSEGALRAPPRRVLLAWHPSRAAARAVRDAIPLLRQAEMVTVLTVVPPGEKGPAGEDIALFLARHRVTVETRTNRAANGAEGEVILGLAADLDADLLVMGAYGHSRLREIFIGGCTRHVLRHMTLPAFFAH
jgi:nucleotide-binding universal stress UspA family protein